MDHLLLPSLPTYYLIKTLKKWTALTNNSQREREILKRLDRRGTNIGAVLGDEMVFGLLMIFQLLRCIASNSRNDDWKLAYITLQNKNAFLLRNIGPAF
jgi:hypothetical protein